MSAELFHHRLRSIWRPWPLVAALALFASAPAGAQQPAVAATRIAACLTCPAAGTPSAMAHGLAAASAGQPGSASGAPGGRFGFGVKGGLLWPSFDETQESTFDENTGWMLGGFLGSSRDRLLSAQAEVQFGKRGATSGAIDFAQFFLETPVLARLNLGARTLGGVTPYFMAGPVFDINLTSTMGGVDVGDRYESLDVGFLAAGGVEITRFFVEARYNKGFKNVLKNGGGGTTDATNRHFAIQLGFRFR